MDFRIRTSVSLLSYILSILRIYEKNEAYFNGRRDLQQ